MKRRRLSTLMLLIVIAALITALVVREWRDTRQRARFAQEMVQVLMDAEKATNGTTKQADGAGDKR